VKKTINNSLSSWQSLEIIQQYTTVMKISNNGGEQGVSPKEIVIFVIIAVKLNSQVYVHKFLCWIYVCENYSVPGVLWFITNLTLPFGPEKLKKLEYKRL
jgi:hypothetical protein